VSAPVAPLPGQMPRELRVEAIRQRLQAAFAPTELEVVDDSHRHAGHEGAKDGRGHFRVRLISPAFAGMPPLACHRAVYAALGTMMETDIHALSIQASGGPAAAP
jgi:BolA family transcriptional regulator, general stress-responsive regulator